MIRTAPRRRRSVALAAAAAGVAMLATAVVNAPADAHESPNDGHIPADTNYGFEVVGRDLLAGIEDGLYTDVWSHDGYAYVGTFQEPSCTNAGVFVVDIEAAIEQFDPADPYGTYAGATVAEIKSRPNTRVNDVKVHQVGDTTVLIATEEPCGDAVPGFPSANGAINKGCPPSSLRDTDGDGFPDAQCNRNNSNGNKDEPGGQGPGPDAQKGDGGISLFDVTDPTNPKPLNKGFLDFRGVHNTFAWDWDGRSYLIGTANTFDFFDTFTVDITDPKKPELLTITGALDWFAVGAFDDGQFETGSSAGIFNHDVWVEVIDGVPTAVVSYWDVGFVTLDVTDPANPVFIDDSTYTDPDPITGEPYEGNAHAAVFGGNGDYIFGGDEDFSPASFAVEYAGASWPAGQALFGADSATLAGDALVYAGGTGCTTGEIPAATADNQVALIDRGACFFSDKGYAAEQQGYVGYVIANNAGDGLLNMSPGDEPLPTIPGVFVGQSTGDAMKGALGLPISASSIFDGWGYLHVINNTGGDVTVDKDGMRGDEFVTVPSGEEVGYYAPAPTVEEFDADGNPYGTEFGDLTMHNIEVDPLTQDDEPTFDSGPRMFVSWYSLGMRALEYRPGHFHDNSGGEGSYSWNVHEVGRFIDEEVGSNFWGIHVDEIDGEQIIVGSDRNTGLWIFQFDCETEVGGETFYCRKPGETPDEP